MSSAIWICRGLAGSYPSYFWPLANGVKTVVMNWWIGGARPLPCRAGPRRRSATAAPAAGRARDPRASTTSRWPESSIIPSVLSTMSGGKVMPRAVPTAIASSIAVHHHLEQRRIVAHHAHRRSRDRGHAAPRREANELDPQVGFDLRCWPSRRNRRACPPLRMRRDDRSAGHRARRTPASAPWYDASGRVDRQPPRYRPRRRRHVRRRHARPPCPSPQRRSAA